MNWRSVSNLFLISICWAGIAFGQETETRPKLAGLTTAYYHNSHADLILSRFPQTDTLDFKGPKQPADLVSLYVDQFPENDTSREISEEYGIPIHADIKSALTLGTGELAVDGVLLIAEHGRYDKSETGQTIYPKRRFFAEVIKVFEESGRVVPVFIDKHLADNWTDAKWIYDEARRLKIPLMAGSSIPVLWRYPETDTKRDGKLKEILAVSYHTLDAYGFHALEAVQALAERREGGETGLKSVQTFVGDAVWQAGENGVWSQQLLDAAVAKFKVRPIPTDQTVRSLMDKSKKEPVLFSIEYEDGLRANLLTLNGAVAEWSAAWKYAGDDSIDSTLFWTQEARPFAHFSALLGEVNSMMLTGDPAYPVERTLMTSGVLDACLISMKNDGKRLETPWLREIEYNSDWNWKQPPPPPPDRPMNGQ
ncbi:MAG: hypothetical protein ACI8UO_002758 [Verrucomicrobiales bacterium]|jgi:hypothetical protein